MNRGAFAWEEFHYVTAYLQPKNLHFAAYIYHCEVPGQAFVDASLKILFTLLTLGEECCDFGVEILCQSQLRLANPGVDIRAKIAENATHFSRVRIKRKDMGTCSFRGRGQDDGGGARRRRSPGGSCRWYHQDSRTRRGL